MRAERNAGSRGRSAGTGPEHGGNAGTRPERGRSVWTRPERAARGPVPEHSRAEIASAAVALADADGLGAVTMRSVAAAIGTAPASLYRYVNGRDELLELMADQAQGELRYDEPGSGQPVTDLLRLAHQGRATYIRHPWLLDIPPSGLLPGPNAVSFLDHALAALAAVDLSGPAKLETIGLFSGAVRLFAQTEIEQQRAGQDTGQWQDSLAGYLLRVTADGQHPHLAAALADQPDADLAREPLFDRAMTRILTGLLPSPIRRSMPGTRRLADSGAMAGEPPELLVPDAAAWRAWLDEHHGDPTGVRLVLAKKGTTEPTSLSYAQALEEALCHGWIDGQSRRRDEATFWQRFTPRRPRSIWSKRNVASAERLMAEGRMHPAGVAAVEAAKADGRWEAAYAGPATIEVPPDLAAALAAEPAAQQMFGRLTSQNRYAILFRLGNAKRAGTRERRIAQFVAMLARGETIYPQQ